MTDIQGFISKMHNTFPQKLFIYFLLEAEFRININMKAKNSNEEKFHLHCEMLKICYNLNKFIFSSENEILIFDNYE